MKDIILNNSRECPTGRGVRWRGAWRKVGSEVDGERRKVESQV